MAQSITERKLNENRADTSQPVLPARVMTVQQPIRLKPEVAVAARFIQTLFGPVTESPVYICSFPNERDDESKPGERHVATRVPSHIEKFAARWDMPDRGLFFCVGAVKPGARRAKENIVETIGLHADIDFKNVDGNPGRDEVVRSLATLM